MSFSVTSFAATFLTLIVFQLPTLTFGFWVNEAVNENGELLDKALTAIFGDSKGINFSFSKIPDKCLEIKELAVSFKILFKPTLPSTTSGGALPGLNPAILAS